MSFDTQFGLSGGDIPDPELMPELEPFVIGVIIPFSTGTVDEAVAQTGALINDAISTAIEQIDIGTLLTQFMSLLPTTQPSTAGWWSNGGQPTYFGG
jgi:hypothetical protein